MTPVSDLVQVSKLDTKFYSDPDYVQHVRDVSGSTPKQRRVRKEERWKREMWLGRGSFGTVESQRCFHGESEGKIRAVKIVQKVDSNNYHRELEAIALFSHTQYERCFVKSFGWYEADESIFITMEYLPNGDLHKYISSPLPENEGQDIVFQILEGLDFMHDSGFAHRDLKPANILVVSKGPDWWVKIADFGISKRATEELTALRTQIGTPAFTAPEVIGFVQPGDEPNDSYTNAVDIWSLGVITFLILTGQTLFKEPRRLGQYLSGSFKFPSHILILNKVSSQGCDFVRSLMSAKPGDRPGAKECLKHPWLDHVIADVAEETQRKLNISHSTPAPLDYNDMEPSASWSTQDQVSAYETQSSTSILTNSPIRTNEEAISLPSTSELAAQIYWLEGIKLKGHSDIVCSVAYSPDGKQIASASGDKTVRLWDSATGAACHTLQGHSKLVRAVAFSPDGKQIASASCDKTVRLWDSATGAARRTLQGHLSLVMAVTFSPDGKQIASASWDKTVRLWDSATGAACHTLQGHSKPVRAVAFSPDGKQLASASDDQTVQLWNSVTGVARPTLQGHSKEVMAVAFSPDGKQIASASYDKTVRLWDSATGAACHTLQGHSDWVWAVAFSPDGYLIASASYDKTVRLWNSATGAALQTLQDHSKWILAIAFSPDGKQIASASKGQTVKLWNSTTDARIATTEAFTASKPTVLKHFKGFFK